MKKIVITGATGFIGQALCNKLAMDFNVVALTRNERKAKSVFGDSVEIVNWDGKSIGKWQSCVDGCDVIVNLAGANVASGRWTVKRKEDILHSRLDTIFILAEAINVSERKPKVFIQSSAIGYYGSRSEEKLDEDSEGGDGFLAKVCREIEKASEGIETAGSRLVIIRSGVVLGSGGGALPRMIKPFRFYAGGFLGNGKQWMSWISLDDEIAAIKHLLEHENIKGVFNLTSPEPVINREFFKTIARVLKRPCWLTVPAIALRNFLGQLAEELLLGSQRVYPKRLLEEGFKFKYSDLESALKTIFYGRS
ncbi:MAG: TIGR01777 family oxidoreductase [Planctomycetota bacterium]|jgi:uncharacterized protein (TIGR01777 family)